MKKKINDELEQKPDAILDRNQILLRSLIFLVVAIGLKFARLFITKNLFGYEITYNDAYSRYVYLAIIPLFWFTCWERIKNKDYVSPSTSGTIVATLVALGALFFPTQFLFNSGAKALLYAELSLGFIREIALLFLYLGRHFIRRFKSEIFLITAVIVFLEIAETITERYWQYSSMLTFGALKRIVPHLGMYNMLDQSKFLIDLNHFRITIGAPCAGIQSLTAYTSLFVVTLLLLRKRNLGMNTGASILWYLVGMAVVYSLNTLRILLILLVGALYSHDFAINMFHSAIGSILFLSFFVLYIKIALPRILKK